MNRPVSYEHAGPGRDWSTPVPAPRPPSTISNHSVDSIPASPGSPGPASPGYANLPDMIQSPWYVCRVLRTNIRTEIQLDIHKQAHIVPSKYEYEYISPLYNIFPYSMPP